MEDDIAINLLKAQPEMVILFILLRQYIGWLL
jgi:hypothetical protein